MDVVAKARKERVEVESVPRNIIEYKALQMGPTSWPMTCFLQGSHSSYRICAGSGLE